MLFRAAELRVAVRAGSSCWLRVAEERYSLAMKQRDRILGELRRPVLEAAARRRASSVALVGSVARGEDTADSDCDFLCEFEPGATLLDVAGLEGDLAEIVGRGVDVVSRRSPRAPIDSMLRDAIAL